MDIEQQYLLTVKLKGVDRPIGGDDLTAIERILDGVIGLAYHEINKVLKVGEVDDSNVTFETDFETNEKV